MVIGLSRVQFGLTKIAWPWSSHGYNYRQIGGHKVLLPINHNCYNFWKTDRLRTNISSETVSKLKNSSTLEIPQLFKDKWLLLWLLWSNLWLVDLTERTKYDWLPQLSDYRCPITANYAITLSDYNSTKWLVKNKAATAPITFEEIVMVMIKFIKK